jgi:hypothetical protein
MTEGRDMDEQPEPDDTELSFAEIEDDTKF